mgnify:CR=1 FL=1
MEININKGQMYILDFSCPKCSREWKVHFHLGFVRTENNELIHVFISPDNNDLVIGYERNNKIYMNNKHLKEISLYECNFCNDGTILKVENRFKEDLKFYRKKYYKNATKPDVILKEEFYSNFGYWEFDGIKKTKEDSRALIISRNLDDQSSAINEKIKKNKKSFKKLGAVSNKILNIIKGHK